MKESWQHKRAADEDTTTLVGMNDLKILSKQIGCQKTKGKPAMDNHSIGVA